eukprot:s140_g61.t1
MEREPGGRLACLQAKPQLLVKLPVFPVALPALPPAPWCCCCSRRIEPESGGRLASLQALAAALTVKLPVFPGPFNCSTVLLLHRPVERESGGRLACLQELAAAASETSGLSWGPCPHAPWCCCCSRPMERESGGRLAFLQGLATAVRETSGVPAESACSDQQCSRRY